MPEGPQRARLGLAQFDLIGAAIAAPQAMPSHCLQWGGMAGLGGLDHVHVLGHVLLLRLGLSKTQNCMIVENAKPHGCRKRITAKASALSPLGPVCECALLAAELVLWRALLRVVRGLGFVVRIWVVAQLGFEQSLEDCRNLSRLGVVPMGFEQSLQNCRNLSRLGVVTFRNVKDT